MSTAGIISVARRSFHAALLAGQLTVDARDVPSIADSSNKRSIALAGAIVKAIGTPEVRIKAAGQTAGGEFEDAVVAFLRATFLNLPHLRPGQWNIECGGGEISRFEQLSHLTALAALMKTHPEVKASLAGDYFITPDVVISRQPESDRYINKSQCIADETMPARSPLRALNNLLPLLHATISCKWTIRSDRVQNTRTEAQNLIRNRKGRVPHIVAVTAEPLPSRISAIALGTADLDCVYHFALQELIDANKALGYDDDILKIMIEGKRLRDISDLPLDLAV